MATNTTLNAKINEIKSKIPSITNLATTSALNAKISEVKGKIHNFPSLATTAALTAAENKMPNISNQVKKIEYNTKIDETEKVLRIMIMRNMLLLWNLTNKHQQKLLED